MQQLKVGTIGVHLEDGAAAAWAAKGGDAVKRRSAQHEVGLWIFAIRCAARKAMQQLKAGAVRVQLVNRAQIVSAATKGCAVESGAGECDSPAQGIVPVIRSAGKRA